MGRPAINLINQRFGRLIVLERTTNAKDGHAQWICQCDCGNITVVSSNVLKRNHCLSCGCLRKEVASQKAKNNYKDLTNQKYGKLTPKEYLGTKNRTGLWRCECDCGNKNFITTSHHLLSGNTKSCGCLTSIGEANIIKILLDNSIEFIPQKIFKDLPLRRFDFYLTEINRLIEFDGQQHYQQSGGAWKTSLETIQKRDKEKNEYALSHNIPLVRIPYWERDNITLDMLLGDKYLVK